MILRLTAAAAIVALAQSNSCLARDSQTDTENAVRQGQEHLCQLMAEQALEYESVYSSNFKEVEFLMEMMKQFCQDFGEE